MFMSFSDEPMECESIEAVELEESAAESAAELEPGAYLPDLRPDSVEQVVQTVDAGR